MGADAVVHSNRMRKVPSEVQDADTRLSAVSTQSEGRREQYARLSAAQSCTIYWVTIG